MEAKLPINAAPNQENAAFTRGLYEKPRYSLVIYNIQTFTILSQQEPLIYIIFTNDLQ